MSISPIEWCGRRPNRRAQLSVEIMGLFAFLIMLLIAVIFVSYKDKLEILQYTGDVYAKNVIGKVRMAINTAAIEGDGFSSDFTIPPTLNGAAYNVSLSGNTIYLEWAGNSRTGRVITGNISGAIARGVNRISNVGGVIVIG